MEPTEQQEVRSNSPAGAPDLDRSGQAHPTRLLAGLLAIHGAFTFSTALFLILPKYLTVYLHADAQQVGIIMTAFGAATLVVTPWLGNFVARVGYMRTLVTANALMMLGSLAFLAVREPGLMAVAARAVHGLAWGLMFAGGSSAVAAIAPPARLGQYIGLYSSINMVSSAIAPASAEWALDALGTHWVFLAAAASALAGIVMSIRFCKGLKGPQAPSRTAGVKPQARSLSTRRFVVFAVLGLAISSILTFHQPLALARGAEHVSAFMVAYTVSALTMRLCFGRLPDRVGHRRLSGLSLLLYGFVTMAMMALGPGTLVLFGVILGIAQGFFYPSFLALCVYEAPVGKQAAALASVNAAFSVGTLGVWPVGILAHHAGFSVAFALIGVVTLAAAATLLTPVRFAIANLSSITAIRRR